MIYQIMYDRLVKYDLNMQGIAIDVTLKLKHALASFTAKIDTGADHCIFARQHANALGIDVENGIPQRFGTVTGSFLAYEHEITLQVANIELDSLVFFATEEPLIAMY
jgi:hypothetical protein